MWRTSESTKKEGKNSWGRVNSSAFQQGHPIFMPSGLIPHIPETGQYHSFWSFNSDGWKMVTRISLTIRYQVSCTARLKHGAGWCVPRWSNKVLHSLVTKYVPILIRVEGQLENPIHHAPFNGQLSILKLLFTGILPYDVLGHGAVEELQEVFYLSSFIISCCEFLKVSNAK